MMIQVAGKKSIFHIALHYAAGVALALGLLNMATAEAVEVKVKPDLAKLVAVAGQPAAVVIGNPAYAEVAVAAGNKLLVQGRNPGKTNVIVLDVDGNRLAEFDVVVSGLKEEEVALYRQGTRATYVCAPECSQVLNVDDSKKVLEDVSSRISTREGIIKMGVNSR